MATERQQRKYPVGIQTFSELKEREYLYIDKTEYVYKLAHGCSKNIFLNRPKGFGKSLLTSTLRSYFEGRRELFKGLAIEKLESEWTEYPVLHFDMSAGVFDSKDSLSRYLRSELTENARRFGIDSIHREGGAGLEELIRKVNERTGRQVVVLIDEYDKPIIDFYVAQETINELKYMLMNFYIPLKACDPYIRFAFMTGTTKLSMADMFGGLNNMYNISMLPEYAAVCGITKEEMTEQMDPDIAILAERRGKTKEETLHDLTDYYDGYHFTWPSPDIFNPYSIMNAFCDGMINAYWFGSGTPTYLIEMLRKFDVLPMEIGGRKCGAEYFDAPTEQMDDITPLLYQSGYLTIKGYSPFRKQYTLDIPNEEVRLGLMKSLLPEYVK